MHFYRIGPGRAVGRLVSLIQYTEHQTEIVACVFYAYNMPFAITNKGVDRLSHPSCPRVYDAIKSFLVQAAESGPRASGSTVRARFGDSCIAEAFLSHAARWSG